MTGGDLEVTWQRSLGINNHGRSFGGLRRAYTEPHCHSAARSMNPARLSRPYFGNSSHELHPQIPPHNASTIISICAQCFVRSIHSTVY